jgi:capsular exopolysaccharide synthesis family protein
MDLNMAPPDLSYPALQGPPFETDRPAEINVKRLLRKLLIALPIIAAGAVFGAYGGALALRKIPRTYTSSVSILIDPKRPGSYGADTDFGNSFVDGSKIADVELILLSSSVLKRVVRTERLADDPAFTSNAPSLLERVLRPIGAYPIVRPEDTQELREGRAVSRLRRMIKTSRIGVTYVVTVEVSAASAIAAQRIAKDIASTYLDEQLDSKLDAAGRDSAWLTSRIAQQRNVLTQSSTAVENLRKKLGVTGADGMSDSTVDRASITDINRELTKAEGELADAQARYEQARIVTHGGGLDSLSEVTSSPVIASLRNAQAAAAERVASLSAHYAADHPERRQAERDEAAVNQQIAQQTSRIIAGLKNDYETALTHRDVLKQKLTDLVAVVNAAANAEGRTELREAERVLDADKVAYEGSLARLRDVEQQQTRQDVEARIISGPDLPDAPSFPKPLLIIGGATILGSLLGAGVAVAMVMRRARVDDVIEAERELALPILTSVPYITKANLAEVSAADSIPDYLIRNPFSLFGESFRLLRLRLNKADSPNHQVVQITSAVAGEGKSTMAASIAISAAMSGIKTVLVDLDLYHQESSRLLEFGDSAGVVDVLDGSVAAINVLRSYKALPLRAIPAGSISNLHPAMIESTRLRDLVDSLREDFDLIVLDTPPVLAISDPLFISTLVDMTVMVIAWRSTPRQYVAEAIRALRATRAPLAGLLLNKVSYTQTPNYRHSYYLGKRYIAA